jgi:hypothetical protein
MNCNARLALLRRHAAVWLAVLITVFGALAPTMSHALVWAQGGNGDWTEICTSTGKRWVKLGSAQNDAPQSTGADASTAQIQTDSPQPQESALSLDHCPFCLLFTDRVAPPPHALDHLFAVSGGFKVPTVRQAFFFITPFALTPPPRGPPAFL